MNRTIGDTQEGTDYSEHSDDTVRNDRQETNVTGGPQADGDNGSPAPQGDPEREQGVRVDLQLPASRIPRRGLQLAHARQRLHTRQIARTMGQAGWDGEVYQPMLQQTVDRQERTAVLVRLARARAIDKCVRSMREQRALIRETLRDRLRLTDPEIEHWEEMTERLMIELSNVSRTLEWMH
jgi:hypothetical protein